MNITLPRDLAKRIKKNTKRRGVSKFLSEAAREKIEYIERKKALDELLRAPAAFTDIKDSVAWVRKMRKLDEKRLKRLGV